MWRINEENWRTVKGLDEQIDALTKQREEILADWKAQLEAEGVTEKPLKSGVATVGWKFVVKRCFNQKKFGAEYPQLLEAFKEPKQTKSFGY